MSAYSAATQPSPNTSFFAPYDGGGGGGGSSLQSPATITPDSAGNTSLLMAASGTGNSQLSVLGTNTTSGRIGLQGYGQGYFVGVLDNFSSLQVKNADVVNPDMEILPNGQIILGRGVASPITTLNNLSVGSSLTSATNAVNTGILSDTTSIITQAAPASGTLSIGSSSSYPTTLQVSDVPKFGAAAYVEVLGTTGAVPLFIAGAQGSGGICSIFPDSASGISSSLNLGASSVASGTVKIRQSADVGFVDVGGNGGQSVRLQGSPAGASVQTALITSDAGTGGQLSLGGSSGSANNILISDTTATFDQQIVQQVAGTVTYSPAIALPNATRGAGTYTFSISTYTTGLWMLMIRVANSNITDGATVNNLFSTLLYIQQQSTPGTSVIVGGGAAGNQNVFSTPIVTGALGADSIQITIGAGAGNMYFNVKMWPLTGILPGFDS